MNDLATAASHQDRVRAEIIDLRDKMSKLDKFLTTSIFNTLPDMERLLLTKQLNIMLEYCDVLAERIERFDREEGLAP